ncbi:hypothetical protein Pyn_40317 [Prunus yedoensis var. nudiflora]|uniref:Uncharacterized protein n=1 Tax=Prunus yedoensis var. nudiflora TaxID=2094558 RepID=A0A314YHK1_PRUYE|nr:hypothetical protein Pyn_40317 [Prunus yedoensis var. nudiflora]
MTTSPTMRQRRMWSLPCCDLGQNHRGRMWHFKVQGWKELRGLQLRSHVPARGRAPLLDDVCTLKCAHAHLHEAC